ncbi:recombinase family protein [Paenibacillus sp. XY044]|uniref:recombinase family protein n=1 Tax=Paenibacillus sp. XY044 TaxID=2026089 RepID=UPI0015C59FBB|nr:recombinase family protein [Paenibacillus sp. XY044]
MKTCIYARKSTNNLGQKETLQNQIDLCKYKSKEFGLEIVDIKTDTGTGTDDNNRPEVKELIDDAINGKYQCVIMKGISRFYRDTEKGLALIKLLDRYGIRVITIEENFDSREQRTGTGKLDTSRITMYLMFAEMESKKTADRVKFQQMESARKGVWTHGKPPFGYRRNDDSKKLEIVEHEAEVIRYIFELYSQGYGVRTITLILNGENNEKKVYLAPVNTWKHDTVTYALNNRTYAGDIIYNQRSSRENLFKKNHKLKMDKRDSWKGLTKNKKQDWVIADDAHPAIIDRELYDSVQRMLKTKSSNRGIKRNFSLFAGIGKCGVCGSGLTLKKMKINKKAPRQSYYYCVKYTKYGKNFCSNHRIEEGQLEKVVLENLKSLHSNPDILKQFMEDKYSKIEDRLKNKKNDQEKIRLRITELTKKVDLLLEKNLNGDITDLQFNKMNQKYSVELDELTSKLEKTVVVNESEGKENSKNENFLRAKKALEKVTDYDKMDKEEKRVLLIDLVKSVTLISEDTESIKIDIEYNFEL